MKLLTTLALLAASLSIPALLIASWFVLSDHSPGEAVRSIVFGAIWFWAALMGTWRCYRRGVRTWARAYLITILILMIAGTLVSMAGGRHPQVPPRALWLPDALLLGTHLMAAVMVWLPVRAEERNTGWSSQLPTD